MIAGLDQAIDDLRQLVHGGLRGVRDRVEALGGRFEVVDLPGGGTRLRGRLPCAS